MEMTVQHPDHEHALARRQLSENCTLRCDTCHLQVRGTTYCCEEQTRSNIVEGESCSFILHEPCALVEFPLQITKHPFHPEHPLELESFRYYCDHCGIPFDIYEMITTLRPPQEEDLIQHVTHEHPLAALDGKAHGIMCRGCGELIRGTTYGCLECLLFLDESCAWLPQEMLQHPFHPQHPLVLKMGSWESSRCDACHDERYYQLAYYCKECNFNLEVPCANLALHMRDQEKEGRAGIDHLSHEHPLLSSHFEESRNIRLGCAVCEVTLSGDVYCCLGCIFSLHKSCANELEQDMAHYLHPEHRLILLPKPQDSSGTFWCDCCERFCSGMVFHCPSCDFDLDPRCALQTSSALRDGAAAKIQHFSHEHPLVLRYFKKGKLLDCCRTSLESAGLAYSCDSCNYVLHKSCAELPLQLEHQFHTLHPLTLVPLESRSFRRLCNNCSSSSGCFAFCCAECGFDLCIPCATEKLTLKHQLHEHTLSYFEQSPLKEGVWCNYCGKACTIDIYRYTPCNFNLHHECLPLPPTIEHECHPYHPLVLFDRYVDKRPDDLWCDCCEEIRNPGRGVYRCEECWYTVHIGCVLPQVRQHQNPPYDYKLIKEIASLEEAIKVMEKDLEDSKQKLERLKGETWKELVNS